MIWRRTVTTDSNGRSHEDVFVTDDTVLVARLDDLAADGYYDPAVDVRLEDFAWGEEDGGSVSGSELLLARRHAVDPGYVEAAVEHATGVQFDEWERARAARIAAIPTLSERVEDDIAAAEAAGEERSELAVRFAARPTTAIPRRLSAMLPRSDLEYLDRDLERAEAMARRGQEIVDLQEPFVRWAAAQGAELLGRGWVGNTLTLDAPAALLRSIIEQPGVLWARRAGRLTQNANFQLDTVRAGIQVQPFLDAGYDGDRTSSRNAHGIWLGILESTTPTGPSLNANHAGWKTALNGSRVFQTWECPDPPIQCGHDLEPCVDSHGMHVASVATADFLDGQVQGMVEADRQNRSGIAQEASVWLGTHTGLLTSFNNAVQRAIQDNVDVINSSAGGSPTCDPGTATGDVINGAYDDGIVWVNSIGNEEMCDPHPCNANDESAAYGSIAVAGTDAFDDGSFDDPRLCLSGGTADGTASWGPIADVAAPSGVYEPMDCPGGFDPPNQQGWCAGSSFAAPHVAGAVTLLKDFWIATFGDASAQSPGRMHAVMLMMGDGCSFFTMDGRWGAGRLRMRKFDNPGMDFPWRVHTLSTTLSSADPIESVFVNPDVGGLNHPVPDDVDALVVTAFCQVPEADKAALTVVLRLYDSDRAAYPPGVAQAYLGEKARIGMSPEAHRYTATLIVYGIDYPQTLPCWMQILFEDKDRDDGDGPPASIEPYYLMDPYGQGQAAAPATCTPPGWCPE